MIVYYYSFGLQITSIGVTPSAWEIFSMTPLSSPSVTKRIASLVTAINVLIAGGFSIAGLMMPMLVLDAGTKAATALDVFVKMNTSAVPLNAFDIIVAQFEARSGKSMHDLMIDLRELCPSLESYASPEQIALQTAALRVDKTPGQASFFQLDLSIVDATWDEIAAGIKWAVQVLEEEGIHDDQRLPCE
jgi:hypothetical protein